MIATPFTQLVGCSAPIQLAGMGPIDTPELAAAVSEAGGLGEVTGIPAPVEVISAMLDAIAQRTNKPFGVNLLIPVLPDREALELIARRARVVDFFWGEPDPTLVDLAHRGGALASWQVGLAALGAGGSRGIRGRRGRGDGDARRARPDRQVPGCPAADQADKRDGGGDGPISRAVGRERACGPAGR